MSKEEKVLELFHNNLNCAQSILYVYGREENIDGNAAKSVSSGFGSGIAGTQQICGALSGAVMVIGVKYFDENNIKVSKEIIYKKSRMIINRFEEINGTINCRELLGLDISTDEGFNTANELNVFNIKCRNYLCNVCHLLDEIL